MSYDTEDETGREAHLAGDQWEGVLEEAHMRAERLRAVRARLCREDDQEPPTTELLAVFSREHGTWVHLRQDYRPAWRRLTPEAKEALREDPEVVPGRFMPEVVHAGMFVSATAWEGQEWSDWSPSVEVQAFVRAMPPAGAEAH